MGGMDKRKFARDLRRRIGTGTEPPECFAPDEDECAECGEVGCTCEEDRREHYREMDREEERYGRA